MTQTSGPRILIVSSLFTPSGRIGARRPERFASGLAARGWDVTVLTLNAKYMVPLDPAFLADPAVTIIRTPVIRPGTWIREGVEWLVSKRGTASPRQPRPPRDAPATQAATPRSLWRHTAALLSRGLYAWEFPDALFLWRPIAVRRLAGRRFDIVLGTIPAFTSALLADEIARNTGARLVLDYRDPWSDLHQDHWTRYGNRGLVDRHRRVEDACLARASVVVATSPTLCRWLAPRTSAKVVLVRNSVDARPPSGTEPDPRDPYLVYAGTLAYGRSLSPLFEGLRLVRERIGPRCPRVAYAGDGGAEALREAAAAGLSDRVVDLGQLSVAETRRRVGSALASVVLSTVGYSYQLPAKIFDLLPERRPILLIAPSDADAAELVRRHDLGWVHTADDIEGIARSIQSMVDGASPAPRDLELLGTRHAIETLDGALRDALA